MILNRSYRTELRRVLATGLGTAHYDWQMATGDALDTIDALVDTLEEIATAYEVNDIGRIATLADDVLRMINDR